MASVNEKHFKAGGGNAAVKKLLAAQAAAARQLTGASQSSQQTAKPTEAQLARLRARVAANGKRELDRQQKTKNRKEASETTYSGNKVYRNGKHIGNMVDGKLVKLNSDKPKTGTTRNWRNGYGAQSDKPSSGDPSTWKKKTETSSVTSSSSSSSSGGGGSSSGSRGGSSGSSGGSSSSSDRSPTPPRRNGAGVKTPLSGGAGGTRPTGPGPKTESKPAKPKSRLEKALSGIGKWEEPKKKETRKKPTSKFLKKTGNTR